jgi:prepilin-type N-terminal cleavage/methylation domain-containing protein
MFGSSPHRLAAFTLVEVLIVVAILGILAAIAIPQFSGAASEASASATYNELQKLRRTIGVWRVRNPGQPAPFLDGDGDTGWGPIVGDAREYLQSAPRNAWVGGPNAKVVHIEAGATPDAAFQTDYGWKFDPDTWEVYAGGFDLHDHPIAHP